MKTIYIIIIVALSISLIIFTVFKNNNDRKDFERNIEDDVKKPDVDL